MLSAMTDPEASIAARIADHFEAIGKDNVRAAEIYADSIVAGVRQQRRTDPRQG